MRTVTYSCDNPSCAEFTEDLNAWFQLGLIRPGELSQFIFMNVSAVACSEDCLWESLRVKVRVS